jgi:hypothetical protein
MKWKLVWGLLALLMALVIVLFCTGCNFDMFKTKAERRSDSTAVSVQRHGSSDSTAAVTTSREDTRKKEDVEWWRIIQQFQPGRDTTINNFYTQPATIIYEGGKGSKEETTSRFDSSAFVQLNLFWKDRFDSLQVRIEDIQKRKESSGGIGLTTLLLVALAVILLPQLLKWVGSNYSFTKKIKNNE